jgi:hypothetical protein
MPKSLSFGSPAVFSLKDPMLSAPSFRRVRPYRENKVPYMFIDFSLEQGRGFVNGVTGIYKGAKTIDIASNYRARHLIFMP